MTVELTINGGKGVVVLGVEIREGDMLVRRGELVLNKPDIRDFAEAVYQAGLSINTLSKRKYIDTLANLLGGDRFKHAFYMAYLLRWHNPDIIRFYGRD